MAGFSQDNFVEIDEIAQVDEDSIVNVIGVVRKIGELRKFRAKDDRIKDMRKIHLVDHQSNTNEIELMFWEDDAKNFPYPINAVLAVKHALVSLHGDEKYLSVVDSTSIDNDPEITESHRPKERLPIKARVAKKSSTLNQWNNRGGQSFSFELVNAKGKFRCTELADTVRHHHNLIEVDKVYWISKYQLKPTNEQLKNDYEMTITPETIIKECQDADAFNIFNFVEIDKLFTKTGVGSIVNVIGVVRAMDQLGTFYNKYEGEEKNKKTFYLVDQSNTNGIELMLWEQDAEDTQYPDHATVLAVKRANLSLHGNKKYLSVAHATSIEINPEITECRRLKEWYDREGSNLFSASSSSESS